MPRSNDPYDLINALENKIDELSINSCNSINASLDDMTHLSEAEIAEYLIQLNIATEDEITLVTKLMGWSEDTLNNILYVRTGYDDIPTYVREVYPNGEV